MRVLIPTYSEEDLVEGLRKGSEEVIRFIYRKNTPPIRQLVTRFPTIILETEDVIQEGLTRLILNIREGKFSGKSALNTYLYSICRNICLKESQKSQQGTRYSENERENQQHETLPGDQDDQENHFEMIQRVVRAKEKMETGCIEIIDMRYGISESPTVTHDSSNRLTPFEEIADLLGIAPANARQRFKRCLDRLIKLVEIETFQVN